MIVGTSTDAVNGSGADSGPGPGGRLAAAEAEVSRLRLGLKGMLPVRLGGGAVLVPGFELGLRHDGGDAETGFGADVGAGLSLSDPARGISSEVRARGLLTHEADGFRQRGISGALQWDQSPETERGVSLNVTQTLGGASSGGAEALLQRGTMEGLAGAGGDDLESRRLDLRMGYGFAMAGGRYTGVPEVGFGLSQDDRDLRLGARLVERVAAGLAFETGLEGTRREPAGAGGAPEHDIALGFGWRLVGVTAGSFEMRLELARREGAGYTEDRAGLRLTAHW